MTIKNPPRRICRNFLSRRMGRVLQYRGIVNISELCFGDIKILALDVSHERA